MPPTPLRFGLSRTTTSPDDAAGREFTDVLGRQLGVAVEFAPTADPRALVSALVAGTTQLAWMSPMSYVAASRQGASLAAVVERGGGLSYRAAVLVRADAPAQGLGELRGRRAAWSDPASASGCVFPRHELAQLGLAAGSDYAEDFHGTARAAMQAVLDGKADFCATFVPQGTAAPDLPEVAAGGPLRVLALTGDIPADGIALSPQLDDGAASQLSTTLGALHAADGGQAALRRLMQADRLLAPPAKLLALVMRLCATPLVAP